jgi:hypothetical protein
MEPGGSLPSSQELSTCIYPDEEGAKFLRNVGSYKSHGVTSQKTPFFTATAVKTSNLSSNIILYHTELLEQSHQHSGNQAEVIRPHYTN